MNPFLRMKPIPLAPTLNILLLASSLNRSAAWSAEAARALPANESSLLYQAQVTLLDNVMPNPAWRPYRGIEPSLALYRGVCNWDAAFLAVGVSHWDAGLAHEQIALLFDRQLKNGMLPDVIWDLGNTDGTINFAKSKPPVMACAVAVVDHWCPDLAFIADLNNDNLTWLFPVSPSKVRQ